MIQLGGKIQISELICGDLFRIMLDSAVNQKALISFDNVHNQWLYSIIICGYYFVPTILFKPEVHVLPSSLRGLICMH